MNDPKDSNAEVLIPKLEQISKCLSNEQPIKYTLQV